jgi:hypothetical protein
MVGTVVWIIPLYAFAVAVGAGVALMYSGENGPHNLVGSAVAVVALHQYLKNL